MSTPSSDPKGSDGKHDFVIRGEGGVVAYFLWFFYSNDLSNVSIPTRGFCQAGNDNTGSICKADKYKKNTAV